MYASKSYTCSLGVVSLGSPRAGSIGVLSLDQVFLDELER